MKTKICFIFFIAISGNFYAQVPSLNSNPSITDKVIYLDFDGHVTSGTLWNSGNTITALPSTLNQANIIQVWKRVREDFRPFNVNVTTDSTKFNNATSITRMRIVITPTSAWYGSAGGVAYLSSFSWGGNPGTPCWVFENQLGYSAKNIAEAASHEAGHTLTLRHQSIYAPVTCSKTAEYNPGIGSGVTGWAPIMGVGYSKNITIWHLGTSSSNCTSIQSDHGGTSPGITSSGFLSFVTDDVGNNYANAKTLNLNTINTLDSGLISQPSDIDMYKFSICNNRYMSFDVKPWALDTNVNGYQGADLDIRFALYNSANTLLAIDTSLSKLNTLVGLTLAPGDYYFTIDGGSSANYTDYGSLGQYFINIKATNPPAISNTIIPSPSICAGQPAVFSYQSSGWPNTWFWTVSNNTTISNYNTAAPNITFNSAGLYTVTLLAITPALTSCAVTMTLNVGNLPQLSVQNPNTQLCFPNPNNFSISLVASGANSYNWMPGNTSGPLRSVSPTVTTVYTVTGTNGSCATSSITAVTVINNFSVSVSATNTFVCFGNSVTINPTGANSYTFNPGGFSTGSLLVSPTVSTTYTITGATGFCRASKTLTLLVNPYFQTDVATSADSVCAGYPAFINGISTINFTVNPGNLTTNPSIVAPLVTTNYTITSANSNCLKDTVITIVTKECNDVGIRQFENKDRLKVYPNPASTSFIIEMPQQMHSIEVFNAFGSLIYAEESFGSELVEIDVQKWAKGIYFIQLSDKHRSTLSKKLVIE